MVTITNKTTLQGKYKKWEKERKRKREGDSRNQSIIQQVLRSTPIPCIEHL